VPMEETTAQPGQSCWANLPEISLARVFWWLGDRDRAHAALVCRHWNQVMMSPALWKCRAFVFCGRPSKSRRSEFESALWYARKFGKYLEELEIRFVNPYSSFLARKFQVTMRTFMARLGNDNNRLRLLTIQHLDLDRVVWRNNIKNAFIKSLKFFLRRQSKSLEYVNLKGARLNIEQGCSILSSLSYLKNNSSVSELNIEDFFSHHLAVYANPLFCETLATFQNLVILSLNYNCISDDFLDTLCEHCSHTLRTIDIKCHIHDPHGQVVWGMSWAKLNKKIPNLKVNFYFDRVIKNDSLTRILIAEIPIRSISLRNCFFSDGDWTMKPTLTDLIPSYRHTLQRLTLEFNNRQESVENELLQLVLLCEKLYFLKLWAFINITFIEKLLEYRQHGKTILRTLKVRILTKKLLLNKEHQTYFNNYKNFPERLWYSLMYFTDESAFPII
uniref:F-box protein 39 n=1 Tax=Latimeria chalumnae TaxID=7897 RepID=H3BHI2_LATCH